MKSMTKIIFEMLRRFANCTGFVRKLSHDSPSSADTATQSCHQAPFGGNAQWRTQWLKTASGIHGAPRGINVSKAYSTRTSTSEYEKYYKNQAKPKIRTANWTPNIFLVCERYAKSLATETSSWARGPQFDCKTMIFN